MSNEIAILGAGMHPWGKWGHNFVQYGVAAAREALAEAEIPWQDIAYVSRRYDTVRLPRLRGRGHIRAGAWLARR